MIAAAACLAAAPARVRADAAPIQALFRQGLVFIWAGPVGRKPRLYLLDTGAELTVIDQQAAAADELHLGRAAQVDAAGGDLAARRTGGLTLRVAGGPLARADALVADLSQPAQAMGLPLAGVLGMDALAAFRVTLDYARGQAWLDQSAPASPAASPLRLSALPYARARVGRDDRQAEGEFQLDTGSNTAVEFWAPFAAHAFPGARGAPTAAVGAGGPEAAARSRIDWLEIAGRRTGPLAVNLADQTRPNGAGLDYAGVIGGPAWAGMTLVLDFPAGRMSVSAAG